MRCGFLFILLLAAPAVAQQPAAAPATPAVSEARLAHPGKPVVPFVENDYIKARAGAERRGVPLFIDMWAPW